MLKIERRQIEVLDFAYLKREPNAIIDTRTMNCIQVCRLDNPLLIYLNCRLLSSTQK